MKKNNFNGQIDLPHFLLKRSKTDVVSTRDKVEFILLEYPRTQIDDLYFLNQCKDIYNFSLKEWKVALLGLRNTLLRAKALERKEKTKNDRYTTK